MLVHTIGFFCMFGVVCLIILIFFWSSPNSGGGSGMSDNGPDGPPVDDFGPEDEGPEGPIHGPDSDPEEVIKIEDDEDCISRRFIGDEEEDDLLEPAFQ